MADVRANPLAVEKIRAKTPVGSPLDTAEWRTVAAGLRDRAQLSAKVENLRFLQRIQERLTTALELVRRPGEGLDGGEGAFQDRGGFVAELQKLSREEGLDPRNDPDTAEQYGGLQDPTSSRRLRLIYDTQIEQAQEYARWKAEQDPDVLDAYPAQEFTRVESRKAPRTDWAQRWLDAGGEVYEQRMIALKNSPVWSKLSRFGTPYPPFDFGSGMGLVDISREEAERLGVIAAGETPVPMEAAFNAGLEASVKDLSPPYQQHLKDAFGKQVEIVDGVAKWFAQ